MTYSDKRMKQLLAYYRAKRIERREYLENKERLIAL